MGRGGYVPSTEPINPTPDPPPPPAAGQPGAQHHQPVIPCIYFGSEQGFDGSGDSDRYIREAMFGGEFGAFRSRQRHCFNEQGGVYPELAKILSLRRQKIALRRGWQYLLAISGDGQNFGYPALQGSGRLLSLVALARAFDDQDLLLAINTAPQAPTSAWVDLYPQSHPAGSTLTCLYSSDPAQAGQAVTVQAQGDQRVLRLTVPAGGFVIFE